MDVEHIADAMTGAAAVVQTVLPQTFTAQDVQTITGHAFFKDSGAHCNHALEYNGVVAAFLVGQLAHCKGSGGVGGAGEVLTAAVVEQEVLRFDNSRTLCFWCIVHHGSVVTVSKDGSEAVALEVFSLLTEGVEFLGSLVLGDGLALFQCFKQPAVKFCFCNTVLQVSLIGVLGFDLVLNRFHQFDWVVAFHQSQIAVVC